MRNRNRDILGQMALIDLLHKIQSNVDDCVLKGFVKDLKIESCNKKCYDCLSEWLNLEKK